MRDISLHLLDIVQNSVRAEAGRVEVEIEADRERDLLRVTVRDDGTGMPESLLKRVTSPFATTRTERPVGLGIPMLLENARQSGGDVEIESTPGRGTEITARFAYGHIDRPPLGDLVGTLVTLIAATPRKPDYAFSFAFDGQSFAFDTAQIREVLGPEVPLDEPEVLQWIRESLTEQINEIVPETVESMEGINQ